MRPSSRFVALSLATVLSAAAAGAAIPGWDQSYPGNVDTFDVSSSVCANDFTLAGDLLVTGATVWLADSAGNDNGVLDSFSGTLSWAIYQEASGVPGALVSSGKAGNLLFADTGRQSLLGNGDIVQLFFEFPRELYLASGTYFLAIHENGWLSADDDSTVWWVAATADVGAAVQVTTTPISPGDWFAAEGDTAFALYGSPAVWAQGDTVGEAGYNVSSSVGASDVLFTEPVRASTLDVWLFENPVVENGGLDGFSGTLSWAVYSDALGAPGALLSSGSDSSPDLVDTGLNASPNDGDLIRARISLGGTYSFDAQTYWIALHEGSWESPADGTSIFWATAVDEVGSSTRLDSDPTDPGTFSFVTGVDTALTLSEIQLFASGFEAGGTCAWSNGAAIVCP